MVTRGLSSYPKLPQKQLPVVGVAVFCFTLKLLSLQMILYSLVQGSPELSWISQVKLISEVGRYVRSLQLKSGQESQINRVSKI